MTIPTLSIVAELFLNVDVEVFFGIFEILRGSCRILIHPSAASIKCATHG